MSYKKSNVTGRTWSTPFNTPFFFRWGEWSIKVPMESLREEYNAWEELQRHREPEDPQTQREADLFSSSPSIAFDWAEDVEQELFSDNSTGNLYSEPDADRVDSPVINQDVTEGVSVDSARATPCAVLDEGEEEDATGDDQAPAHLTTPTSSTDVDNRVYRVIKVSTTSNALSIHMVKDASIAASDGWTTAQKLSEAIQFLAGAGLLKLDTYATVFDTAARGCASGRPFWLNDPACGYEIVV